MLNYKSFLLILLFNVILSNVVLAMEVELELHEREAPKKVRLPFSYAHLNTVEDKKNIVYVPEECCFFLKKNSPIRVLVGPLQPCLLIALSNLENGDIIIFHKYFNSSIDDALQKAKEKLNIQNSDNIRGQIFTNTMKKYTESCTTAFGKTTMQKLHEGRTQIDEIKFIKNKIQEYFGINDKNQIKANIFTSTLKDFALGNYELAELYVLVSEGLRLESICTMHEKVFGNFENIRNIGKRVYAHSLSQNKVKYNIHHSLNLDQSVKKENYFYGKRPFMEITEKENNFFFIEEKVDENK